MNIDLIWLIACIAIASIACTEIAVLILKYIDKEDESTYRLKNTIENKHYRNYRRRVIQKRYYRKGR